MKIERAHQTMSAAGSLLKQLRRGVQALAVAGAAVLGLAAAPSAHAATNLSSAVNTAQALTLVGPVSQGDNAAPAATPPAAPAGDKSDATPAPDGPKVYFLTLAGEFGRDVNGQVMERVVRDMKRHQPDIVIFRLEMENVSRGEKTETFMDDPRSNWKVMQVAEFATTFIDKVRDDPEFKTKPRYIMWVNRALGGAAFLPWFVPDMYMTSDGLIGGLGGLELSHGAQDRVVSEKMFGIMQATAEGIAIRGGYEPRLMRALMRLEYTLSYTLVGGAPVFYEDESGQFVIKRNGLDRDKSDTAEDLVRLRGKMWLNIRPELGKELKVLKGIADTREELLQELGIARNANVLKHRGDEILRGWSREIGKDEENLTRLWREFGRVQVQGATPEERNRGRGRQIGFLNQILGIYDKYQGEALNPRNFRGVPPPPNIRVFIDQIQREMRLDRR